jgi:hypothetical protein
MFPILLSAALTCVVSLSLGQAALRLCGFRRWSWIAPAVGISVAMLISVAAIHAPGHCATVAVVLGGLTLLAVVWCWREPAHRPPLPDLAAAAPVAVMVLVPFLAAGRPGIPGVSLDNDMTTHLLWAEGILFQQAAAVFPLPVDYPLGPHAVAAVLAKGLGIRIDYSFAGLAMAVPVVNAWTALALVPRARWPGKVLAATVVGMPFLIAGYHGEGSFKEVLFAGIILALVAFLAEVRTIEGKGRWIPFALLLGGTLSVYSIAGLPWPVAIGGAWLVVVAFGCVRRRGVGGLLTAARRELGALAFACGVLFIALVPQIPRLVHFVSIRASVNGTGIEASSLGNLFGPLPGWEAFGVWNNPDFRLPSSPAFTGGMWTAFVLGLVLLGTFWALRRGRWVLPLAAAAAMLVWALSGESQSPYITAKALVLASPLLLALAVLPLVERESLPSPGLVLAPVLGLVLFCAVTWSDLRALRVSPVGPTDHAVELRSLRETIGTQPTLFIGNDDFAQWELAGVPVWGPVMLGARFMPIRPQKAWTSGQPLDFDSVSDDVFNSYRWVITPRDPTASAPPPQLHLVRQTPSYSLWRRVGTVEPRSILAEGDMPGAVLRCGGRQGRKLVARGGVAEIRARPLVMPGVSVPPEQTVSVQLSLPPGRWELGAQYFSPLPVEVSGAGIQTTLPANLERLGPRWRVGVLTVAGKKPASLSFHVDGTLLSPGTAAADLTQLVATRAGSREQVVPMRRACGRYVDWYRSARQ